jgi:hypothetical protein
LVLLEQQFILSDIEFIPTTAILPYRYSISVTVTQVSPKRDEEFANPYGTTEPEQFVTRKPCSVNRPNDLYFHQLFQKRLIFAQTMPSLV